MEQHQQAAPQPVSFEVELNKQLTVNPPIRQRLEQREKNPVTMEQIQEKLEKAAERKTQVIASQISQVKENTDKVSIIQERKSSMERAEGQRVVEVIDKKHSKAEANRTVQLTNIQEKAKNHNKKVQLIRERKSSQERAQEERIVTETAKRHTDAEKRYVNALDSIQEKCKNHNQKVQQVIQTKEERIQQELDSKKSKIEDKLTRASAAATKNTQAEKAKLYNQKLQEKIEGFQNAQQEELDTKKQKIEDKLSTAANRRDEVIGQVKEKAQQSYAPKMSPQKQQQEQ